MKPAISILMINRNQGRFIATAILSVLNQTNQDWELVIIDDASTDNSAEIIKGFLPNRRLKYFSNPRRLGIGLSRRQSVDLAGADILGILDSDDSLEPEAVDKMIEAHHRHSAGLIYSQLIVCDQDLRPLAAGRNGPIPATSSNLLLNRISHFATFKRAAYLRTAGYDPTLALAEDKDLYFKLEEVTDSLFINLPLYHYRRHRQSASSYGWRRWWALIQQYKVKYKAYRRRLGDPEKKIGLLSLLPQRWRPTGRD